MDLAGARRLVSGAFINRCFKVSDHRIKTATLRRVRNLEVTVEMLARKCKDLESLTILDDQMLSKKTYELIVAAPNLRHFSIATSRHEDIRYVLMTNKSLESLTCSQLRSRGLDSIGQPGVPRLPKTLTKLYLSYSQSFGSDALFVRPC